MPCILSNFNNYIGTVMVIFHELDSGPLNETAMIGISGKVSPVLPVLLVIAAVMSQFSAAVADTVGSGGLTVEASKGRHPTQQFLVSSERGYLAYLANEYI